MTTDETTSLFASAAAFAIGIAAYHPSAGLLLVPDSADRALRRYRLTNRGFDIEARGVRRRLHLGHPLKLTD